MARKTTWKDWAAMLTVSILLLAAFAGCMRLAGTVNHVDNRPCTIEDVNRGVDRCDNDLPPELPSGTD